MSNSTKYRLADSLKHLLNTKPMDYITISDITDYCGINRQTFYYHFSDMSSLAEWMIRQEARKAISEISFPKEWRKCILRLLVMLEENRTFVLQVYHSKMSGKMYRLMFETCCDFINLSYQKFCSEKVLNDEDIVLTVRFFAYALTGVLGEWFGNDMKVPAEDIAVRLSDMMNSAFPAVIKFYETKKEPQ